MPKFPCLLALLVSAALPPSLSLAQQPVRLQADTPQQKAAAKAGPFREWRYYRSITLDTTAAGANVSGDVLAYPVAVALDASSFDFRQARPDGSDLRFSSAADQVVLPHAIEHWDAAGRAALIWVKVPKVRGNSRERAFLMHWGRGDSDASRSDVAKPAVTSRASVFDVEDGFVGVWHLNDEGGVTPDGYKDATANAAHGTGVNLAGDARVPARLGPGLSLAHAKTQWVKVDGDKRKLFDLTKAVTFSIWARARSFSNRGDEARRSLPGYETMFAKGDNSWRLQKFGIRDWHKPPADLLEICVEQPPRADLCVVGKTDMALDRWYHLVGVHEHPYVKFYVNGVLDKVETFDVDWTSGDHPVGIGNQSQFPDRGRSWDGVLDEARVLRVAKDQHWIKLDYESQREGQTFLSFGKVERR